MMKTDAPNNKIRGHLLFWNCREEREKDGMDIEIKFS